MKSFFYGWLSLSCNLKLFFFLPSTEIPVRAGTGESVGRTWWTYNYTVTSVWPLTSCPTKRLRKIQIHCNNNGSMSNLTWKLQYVDDILVEGMLGCPELLTVPTMNALDFVHTTNFMYRDLFWLIIFLYRSLFCWISLFVIKHICYFIGM